MLGKKLKSLLKSHNLSISELASRTKVPKTNIQGWLNGSSPNIEQLDKVANYFGITIEELAFDRKPKNVIEEIFTEALVHTGHYKIQITKLTKKGESDE